MSLDTVEIRVIRERLDDNGNPKAHPYTGMPLVNGGAVLLPDGVKAFPGEVHAVPREYGENLAKDMPHVVELETAYQRRMARILANQQRHNQNRFDVQQAMLGSAREKEAELKMKALHAEKRKREAELIAEASSAKQAEAAKADEIQRLTDMMGKLMSSIEEKDRLHQERMDQLQNELKQAQAQLSEKPRPAPIPEPATPPPAEPKHEKKQVRRD